MRPLSQIEVRQVDVDAMEMFRIPGLVLMENAGRGCAEVVARQWVPGRVVVCCGKGNNGGDGFVIARHLENLGWKVCVRLACREEDVAGDAAVFLRVVQLTGIDSRYVSIDDAEKWQELQDRLRESDLIIDALLGTGLTGEVRSPYREWIEAINQSGRPVLAVDLPSGMDCNTGKPLGSCVRATRTATMVATKLGFENANSKLWTGPIEVIDIGIPLIQRQALTRQAPAPADGRNLS